METIFRGHNAIKQVLVQFKHQQSYHIKHNRIHVTIITRQCVQYCVQVYI